MEVKGKGRIGIARSITCLGSKEEESEDMLWGGERGAEGNRKEKMQREKRSKKRNSTETKSPRSFVFFLFIRSNPGHEVGECRWHVAC